MRELLARTLGALTALVVVGLAAAFSLVQNTPGREQAQPPARQAAPVAERLAGGRSAYDRNGCAGCHSIGEQGNPRSPLDGVGDRLTRDAIRDWIVASDRVKARLSSGTARIKQSYATLPEQERRELVDLVESLRVQDDAGKR
jgi:mono/diheme cytochrome c family protein